MSTRDPSRSTAARCGRGSRPTTARTSRTGSPSSSPARAGAIRIASPVLTSGPILGHDGRGRRRAPVRRRRRRRPDAGERGLPPVADERRQRVEDPAARGCACGRRRSPGKPSTPWSPDGCVHDFMHAKCVVADDVVFVGSFNLSRSGERNAENVARDRERRDRRHARRVRRRRSAPGTRRRPCRRPPVCARRGVPASLEPTIAPSPRASPPSPLRRHRRRLGARLPGAPHCRVFPATNPWNQRVDTLPVAADSKTIVALDRRERAPARGLRLGALGRQPDRHPGHRRRRARRRARRSPSTTRTRATPGPYPIPANVKIEGGGDAPRHPRRRATPASSTSSTRSRAPPSGGWHAGSGAIWSLALEPAATRRLDVGRRGRAADPPRPRALRRGRSRPDRPRAPVHRLAHAARVRLAGAALRELADERVAAADGAARAAEGELRHLAASRRRPAIVLQALKRYGMIVADNGSSWYISGAPDPRWSNDDLHTLGRVPGSAFEVVDTSSLRH